jgi:3-hydroxyisobutyrate dehydrogenase
MGKHIANYLLKVSDNFFIVQRNTENTRSFIKGNRRKLTVLDSYKQLGELSNIIITCVGDDSDLKSIFLGKKGIIYGLKKKTLLIDHTTSSEKVSKEIYKRCTKKNCYFFDSPMSGGEVGAKEGKLSLMVGGSKKKFDDLKKITKYYSKSCIYMGPSGSGQLTKMVNQIFVANIIQGLAEGLTFAKDKKLDIKKLLKVTSVGAGQSWQLENRGLTMTKNKFNFGFMNKLMLKDLKLVFDNLDDVKKLPLTIQIKRYYQKLVKLGYKDEDTSSLIRLLK